jgi:hypothetical protein
LHSKYSPLRKKEFLIRRHYSANQEQEQVYGSGAGGLTCIDNYCWMPGGYGGQPIQAWI